MQWIAKGEGDPCRWCITYMWCITYTGIVQISNKSDGPPLTWQPVITPHTSTSTRNITMPIDYLGKRRESTALERVRIIELNAEGYSQRKIAQKMGSVSKTTVQRVLQQWKSGQLNPTPRNGRG